MGTVRDTTKYSTSSSSPGGGGGKKGGKRKASGGKARVSVKHFDAEDLSVAHALAEGMLDQKLASRDKWQVATQRNLAEIRAECMKVRRQVASQDEHIDTVQMQVEDELAGLMRCREELQGLMAAQRTHTAAHSTELEKVVRELQEHRDYTYSQLARMKKWVEKQVQPLVDEETLLTQLSGLQERWDNEMASAKDELATRMDDKVRSVNESVDHKLAGLRETQRSTEKEEKGNIGEIQQLRQDVQMMLRRIVELEHHSGRLNDENTKLKAALDVARTQANSMEDSMLHVTRELERCVHTVRTLPSTHSHPLPPPPLPPVDLGPLEQRVYHMSRDLRLLGEDCSRLKTRSDDSLLQLRHELTSRMDELHAAVLKALQFDSGKHEFENRRLREGVVDAHKKLDDLAKDLYRTRDHLMIELKSKRNAPPQHQQPYQHHRPRRYGAEEDGIERAYFGGPYNETGTHGRSRSRSRSRSRGSQPRGHVRSRSRSPPATSAEMLYLPLNRPRDTLPAPASEQPVPPHPIPARSEPPRRHQRSHEVIVIEEDDDDEGEEGATRGENPTASVNEAVEAADATEPPPYMAPPDQVMDEEEQAVVDTAAGSDEPDTANAESSYDATNAPAETSIQPTVKPGATVDDLVVGGLLYLCFGGAPTLDVEWTARFTSIRASELVDAGEMLQFQLHHQALAPFPPYLSQFVVKAMQARLTGSSCSPSGDSSGEGVTLSSLTSGSVSETLTTSLVSIRTSWSERMCEILSRRLMGRNQQSPATLAPPPPPSSVTTAHHREWAMGHMKALTALLEKQNPNKSLIWQAFSVETTSPGVLLFLCFFDVVRFDDQVPPCGRFKLNDLGKRVLANLWECTLNKCPASLFVECSWLDDQSRSPITMPFLGVAHVLTSLLLWSSPLLQETPIKNVSEVIIQGVQQLLPTLVVDGSQDAPRMVSMGATTTIEVVIENHSWPTLMELDGFFEVVRLIAA